jgi:SAM-dependent methyltransferase
MNNKILDVACGTGIHANLLQNEGFKVTGFDISEEMLKEARKKNLEIKFFQEDMKKLSLNEKFGTIICFFNSILYNKNREEIRNTLLKFYMHLEKGGILIFDIVDKTIGINSKKKKYLYKDKILKISFEPQWIYNEKDNIMDLEIDFIINDEKLHDHHVMGAFGCEELRQILEELGFEVMILERNFDTIKPYNAKKKTAIFVCRK